MPTATETHPISALLRRRRPAPPPAPPGTAELRAGDSRVVIVPALGGRIIALELAGRQWLWTAPGLETASSEDPAAGAALGGMDECFPTVAEATVPVGGVPVTFPEGGELIARRAETKIATPRGVMEAVSTWRGERHPYRFTRTVRVTAEGVVEMRYEARNDGEAPLPFIWASRPFFPLSAETRILLPQRSRVRVASQHGIDLGGTGTGAASEHQWPHLRLEKRVVDLSRPESVARKYAAKLFVDPVGGTVAIEEPPLRLELVVDPQEVPELGVWINRRAIAPKKQRAPNLIALQPGIGAPDSLAEAMGSWQSARTLAPGERLRWKVQWRARRIEDLRPEP